jgi:arsenate reductase
MAFHVLFLCTGNSARSILCEATLRHLGGNRFVALSAGSQPVGTVNPDALAELQQRGIATIGARSKSWDEYADGPRFDLVITTCDSAAATTCPVFFGDFAKAHWDLPDPAAILDTPPRRREAFTQIEDVIVARLKALIVLPVESMTRDQLQRELTAIGERIPAPTITVVAP